MFILRLLNLFLLGSLVGCFAGAMAGLIVFAPFVGGAWLLTLIAIAGSDGAETEAATRTEPEPTRPFISNEAVDAGLSSVSIATDARA